MMEKNAGDVINPSASSANNSSFSTINKFLNRCDPYAPIVWQDDFQNWNDSQILANQVPSFLSISSSLSDSKSELSSPDDWLCGGNIGSRNAVLVFRSAALANQTDEAIQNKPAFQLHVTYKVSQAETKLLSKLLDCHGVSEVANNSSDFNLLWTGSHPKPGVLRSLTPYQRVNHFPRSYEMTRKDRLYKNIERMQHTKGYKHFDFVPQTFVMPAEFKEFTSTHYRIKGPWIVKPVASSRGRGIFIVENPSQVPLDEPVVVAKYINKPLLVEGHKCDLRLYVAVTSFDPLLVYIYEEGLVRFATVRYDVSRRQLWNPCMHLCNYSINKYHSDYVKSDDPSAENVGHKWTLSALLRHLKAQGKDTAHLMAQVEDMVVKAILACANSIVSACQMFVPNSSNCFELYGFDILIDENLKPWLLEVNLSPSLNCDTPLDVRLKSAMLADLLTLVGIPAIDPILRSSVSSFTQQTSFTSNAPVKANPSIRMKFGNCRRVHSADGLSNSSLPRKTSSVNHGPRILSSMMSLTPEEARTVKIAKTQFERRGGFVRIFPTAESWTKYSQYLDPITGVPVLGNVGSSYNYMSPHNYNQILFMQLFPDVPIVTTKAEKIGLIGRQHQSIERKRPVLDKPGIPRARVDRYERMLSQGHKSSLCPKKIPLKESHSLELKKQLLDIIRSGKKMTQGEARKAFSQYLACVLNRIASSPDQEGHVEIVVKFLQKASTYLKTPFPLNVPSHKLTGKDRAAMVSKQLSDFLCLYNKETDLYGEVLEVPSQIPKKLFKDFLEHARECDLEELLTMQTLHTVPSLKGPRTGTTIQGFLKCLPNVSGSCFKTPATRSNSNARQVSRLS